MYNFRDTAAVCYYNKVKLYAYFAMIRSYVSIDPVVLMVFASAMYNQHINYHRNMLRVHPDNLQHFWSSVYWQRHKKIDVTTLQQYFV